MGQVGDSYLEKWDKVIKSEEAQELREENEEVYQEITEFFAEQLRRGRVDRATVVNMCYGLIIQHTARMGICPACEMYEASELIHNDIGCSEVQ
jgi:hypothetical protein